MTTREGQPFVQCVGCGRRVQCIKMNDGTVYRPFAWTFPEPHPGRPFATDPLRGKCGICSAPRPTMKQVGPDEYVWSVEVDR